MPQSVLLKEYQELVLQGINVQDPPLPEQKPDQLVYLRASAKLPTSLLMIQLLIPTLTIVLALFLLLFESAGLERVLPVT